MPWSAARLRRARPTCSLSSLISTSPPGECAAVVTRPLTKLLHEHPRQVRRVAKSGALGDILQAAVIRGEEASRDLDADPRQVVHERQAGVRPKDFGKLPG